MKDDVTRLAPKMAHRVRDEISFIQNAMQYVIEDESISTDARDKIEVIKDYLGNVAQHARSFLIITDHEHARLTALDVGVALSNLSNLFKNLCEGYTLRMDIDHDLWPIYADEGQIGLVVLPIVVNARDAMRKGGTIWIRARNITNTQHDAIARTQTFGNEDFVLIEVIDEGVGIAKAILDRIFDPFFSTKGRRGCGFGLAHVHSTVKNLNGYIRVESRLGKGSTFSIFLPRSRGKGDQDVREGPLT